ncbi:MAG: LuxR C-terminal-related transcriptional regulator [Sediminibacterium sp.]|jgi:DNA-binding CsgD family transcriptional regulator
MTELFYEKYLSDKSLQPNSNVDVTVHAKIARFPDEAIYVYCFETNCIVYADGWPELLGYGNDEINLQMLIHLTTPDYINFIREINNESIKFIMRKTENLTDYSLVIESKLFSKTGKQIPLIISVGVLESENGKPLRILGSFKQNPRIPHPGNKYFKASGTGIEELVENMKLIADRESILGEREREIITKLANGLGLRATAQALFISKSSVEKIVSKLSKKIDVKNTYELISFAFKNNWI